MQQHLTIIVVTYNNEAIIEGFLQKVPAAVAEPAFGVTLIVVDNGSADRTAALAEQCSLVDQVVLPTRNEGYAAGINAGIQAAPDSTTCYLVLNPDVTLNPGCVAPLVAALGQPGVGLVVPRLVDEHGNMQYSLRRRPSLGRSLGEACLGGLRSGRWPALGELVLDPEAYQQPTVADWATGGAMMFSRECIDAVGLWDESFFLYEEEVEFCLRAADGGFRLQLVPESEMMRFVGDEPDKPHFRALIRHNKLAHYRRRHGRLATECFRLALLLNEVLRLPSRRKGTVAAIKALCTGRVPVLEAIRERNQSPV